MIRGTTRWPLALLLAACSPNGGETAAAGADTTGAMGGAQNPPLACAPSQNMAIEGRASPYDSTLFTIRGQEAKLCYGRPSVRGRTIFGDLVPYDTLWRTGANEPTTIHLPVAATIAGVPVEPGSYAIYTVPGRSEWQVVVNASTSQWGHESQYNDEVRTREVGRGAVTAERTDAPVEIMNIHAEVDDPGVNLVIEWEHTRVTVPVRPQT